MMSASQVNHPSDCSQGAPSHRPVLRLGIDVGSTTVKLVLIATAADPADDRIEFSTYRRHHANIAGELDALFDDVCAQFPDTVVRGAITGSGGLAVADAVGLPFVQEVIAETEAINRHDPDTDVIIELGGEDAKITYLKPVPEQRMNGTCAGGTGAFIDQMASLLHTDAAGLDELASRYETLYPIASRCGVFAKSDLQPLLNEGASHTDLAASIFTAVVNQTIAGLACGRPIRGHVVFLGGPLFFLSELRKAFERALGDQVASFRTPEKAQLYVAIGAALLADGEPVPLAQVADRARGGARGGPTSHRMRPLFADATERAEFVERHRLHAVERADLTAAVGDCFLGIDAGSTTIKAVLLDAQRRLLFSHYASNEGDPVGNAVAILKRIRESLPEDARIARTCVTGYGEGLVKAALRAEDGEIETMAHYRAAEFLSPGVTSVIDIGGQDMKYLRVKDGVIDSISVNEACSSGCGSFLSTFATTMGRDIATFAREALDAQAPVDLGSRCTVFMNSSVKQAQKEGADVAEISAGLSYSVVRNALYKVIKLKDPSQLGERVVVQGGTFLNDAVLRAFELLTEREVVRPDIAGLMGAFGAALTARQRHAEAAPPLEHQGWVRGRDGIPAGAEAGTGSGAEPQACAATGDLMAIPALAPQSEVEPQPAGLLTMAELEDFTHSTDLGDCSLCQNHCQLTTSTFGDGSQHVTGNRCDRGADPDPASARKRPKSGLPNVVEEKYARIFRYRRLTRAQATRGDIGIPRALNMYENYPFWFTVLTALGFRVVLSKRSDHDLFERGMDSIPSENVCYPAKLTHGHIEDLVARGVRTIFYPAIAYERGQLDAADNHFNCPVVMSYPEVIGNNLDSVREQGVELIRPFLSLANEDLLVDRLMDTLAAYDINRDEMAAAVAAGFAEDDAVREDIRAMGRAALDFCERTGTRGIVLAGRPYHADPEIHHGIPELINSLGMAVLTEDSVIGLDGDPSTSLLRTPLKVRNQWTYHARLYEAAAFVGTRDDLELVQLNSFGCGIDAITGEQVAEILAECGKVYTALKIDEVSNLGAARIRLRSLQAATHERAAVARARSGDELAVSAADEVVAPPAERVVFTQEMKKSHTLLLPQMAPIQFRLFEAVFRRSGYNVVLLERARPEAVELGLKHVNNDACFPAIVVVGQLLDALRSGEFDTENCSVFISQTGGMCRATNYAALLRKGLAESAFGHVPVVSLSAYGIESNPGFSFTLPMLHRIIQAVVLGDLLQTCLLRTRPYEAIDGAALRLYETWDQVVREFFTDRGWSATLGRRVGYRWMIDAIVRDFDRIPLRDEPRRPRVGIVGEILVKFHPDANNDVVSVVESEGCEAVMPGLMGFVLNSVATAHWNYEQYGVGEKARFVKRGVKALLEKYQTPAVRALRRTGGKFDVPEPIDELAAKASEVVSLGNQAGEGWYLVAEMIALIEEGTPNIICAQPFACLPNHVTGKGMFRELRRRYPQANIVSVDYDPGASQVNQLNRIKLMISTAITRSRVPESERLPADPAADRAASTQRRGELDELVGDRV